MTPPKPKPAPKLREESGDALADQVKRHAASLESILELLRFIGPGLPGLLLSDPAGVEERLRNLKNPGGKRAGELLNDADER